VLLLQILTLLLLLLPLVLLLPLLLPLPAVLQRLTCSLKPGRLVAPTCAGKYCAHLFTPASSKANTQHE
jgi:hypothetical protein